MSRGGITLRKFEPIKPEKEVISLREKIADWTKNKEDLEEEIKELEKSKNKKEKESCQNRIVNSGQQAPVGKQ